MNLLGKGTDNKLALGGLMLINEFGDLSPFEDSSRATIKVS